MIDADLVIAITDGEHHRRTRNSAAEVFEEIERGAIGPVNVFDDEQRRLMTQRRQHIWKKFFARRLDIDLEIGGDVVQRSEGTRREERFASRLEHAQLVFTAADECVE